MTKVTWKGEDALHGIDQTGPSALTWKGIRFPKDKAIEVNDPYMIQKARTNQSFKVEDDKAAASPEPEPVVEDEPPVHAPKRGRPLQKRKTYDADAE